MAYIRHIYFHLTGTTRPSSPDLPASRLTDPPLKLSSSKIVFRMLLRITWDAWGLTWRRTGVYKCRCSRKQILKYVPRTKNRLIVPLVTATVGEVGLVWYLASYHYTSISSWPIAHLLLATVVHSAVAMAPGRSATYITSRDLTSTSTYLTTASVSAGGCFANPPVRLLDSDDPILQNLGWISL